MKFKRFWNWRFPLAGALAALALAVGVTIFLPQKSHTAALVARSEICAGCEITAREVQVRGLDPRAVPEKYLASPQDVEGRKAAVALEAGTILQPSLLLENSMGDLREGEVAFALSIDDPAVAGFLRPVKQLRSGAPSPRQKTSFLLLGSASWGWRPQRIASSEPPSRKPLFT